MTVTASTGPGKARSFIRVRHVGVTGAQALEPLYVAFPKYYQGVRLEVDQPGHEPVPIKDANTTGGSFTTLYHNAYP